MCTIDGLFGLMIHAGDTPPREPPILGVRYQIDPSIPKRSSLMCTPGCIVRSAIGFDGVQGAETDTIW